MYDGLPYRRGYYSISRRLIVKSVTRLYSGNCFNFLHKLFAGGGSFPAKLRVTKIVPVQPENVVLLLAVVPIFSKIFEAVWLNMNFMNVL